MHIKDISSLNREESKKHLSKNRNKQNFLRSFLFDFQSIESSYENSMLYGLFSFLKNKLFFLGRFKQKIAGKTESSIICNASGKLSDILFSVHLRSYGITLFFFGIFNLLINVMKSLNLAYVGNGSFNIDLIRTIFGSFIILIIAGLLASSHKSLGDSVSNSRFLSFFLFTVLNIDKRDISKNIGLNINSAFFAILGCSLGLISAVITSNCLLIAILSIICLVTVLKNPETGIILTFLVLPFAGERILICCVLICVISVFLKVMRNKRVMKFNVIDVFVLLLALTILLSGISGVEKVGSFGSSLKIIALLLFGWVLSNTVKTSILAEKCVNALVISSTFVAAIGIVNFFFDLYFSNSENLFLNMLGEFLKSVPFSSDGSYAELVVLILPFAFSLHRKSKILGGLSVLICFLYAVLSMDISVWISVAIISILYVCFLSPNLFVYFGIVISLLIAVNCIFPNLFLNVLGFLKQISNHELIINAVNTSNYFGLSSSLDFLLSGAGSGTGVVRHVYNCMFGTEASALAESSSMIIRIILNYGIVAVFLMLVIYLLFVSNCAGLFYSDKFCKISLKYYIVSCLAAGTLILLKGIILPTLMSSNLVLAAVLILYLSVSIRRCSQIEYVPEAHEHELNEYIL